MIAPRLTDNLATIRQIGTPRFQIAGIALRPENHVRKGIARVDHLNDRTLMLQHGKSALAGRQVYHITSDIIQL